MHILPLNPFKEVFMSLYSVNININTRFSLEGGTKDFMQIPILSIGVHFWGKGYCSLSEYYKGSVRIIQTNDCWTYVGKESIQQQYFGDFNLTTCTQKKRQRKRKRKEKKNAIIGQDHTFSKKFAPATRQPISSSLSRLTPNLSLKRSANLYAPPPVAFSKTVIS